MKRIMLVCAVVLMFATGAMAQQKIAVIDIARCATGSAAGIKASEDMKKMEAERTAKLQPLLAELQKLDADFKAQEKVLTDTAKQAKLEELQRKGTEYQNQAMSFEKEMQQKNEDYTVSILNDLEKIIEAVAKKGGYDMVVHRQTMAYGPTVKDLTEDVIKAYNEQKK